MLREPASFRDHAATVFMDGERVLRGLRQPALDNWRAIARSAFFAESQRSGTTIGTTESDPAPIRHNSHREHAAWLEHERIPFVSYPYEWTFEMLRGAARLHLEMVEAALEDGLITKDGSSDNIQWKGPFPTLVDIGSIEKYRPGRPWFGYSQFCALFLNPLVIHALCGVPFHSFLRGSIDGIGPRHTAALLGLRRGLRRGVFRHVLLHGLLERGLSLETQEKAEISSHSVFNAATIRKLVRSLNRTIMALPAPTAGGVWRQYERTHSYGDDDFREKIAFVETVCGEKDRILIWDIGANSGRFSRIAAKNGRYVLALDADHDVTDLHYKRLRDEKVSNILPLVVDATDPSPSIGWRLNERADLASRGKPDLILALALIHHLAISRNVPVDQIVEWLADLAPEAVIEFVGRDDEMTRTLLRHKEDRFSDYDEAAFEAHLGRHYRITRKLRLKGGARALYHVVRD